MIVTMPDGSRWATVPEAARSVRVREQTIRVWVSRNRVRSHRVGRTTWVNVDDVADRELAWRRRVVADGQ
jgi:excisionase family DNA binding protein